MQLVAFHKCLCKIEKERRNLCDYIIYIICGEGRAIMSNKFGKILLAGAAIGSALGTTFYLMKKKK